MNIASNRRIAAAASGPRYALLALAALFGPGSVALAQPSPALHAKAVGSIDAAGMANMAQRGGHVRVIVLFQSPVAPESIQTDAASIASVTTRVAAARNAVLSTHFSGAGPGFARGLTNFPITAGFALNVTAAELEALAADPRVTHIQHDTPEPHTLIESVPQIGMTPVWAAGGTGTGRTVAVIDTGVQANHEFMGGGVSAEACFSGAGAADTSARQSLCPNTTNSQTGAGAASATTTKCNDAAAPSTATNLCTHGTHVAGIAAGLNSSPSAGEPLFGVAKFSFIMAIQVFTRFNTDADCGAGLSPCALAFTSDQISALNYVLANTNPGGRPVASINMSLGGGSFAGNCDGDSRKPIIDNLRSAGIITAIASGNSSFTGAVGAPGCISTAFTVGSITKSNVISSFSNMSPIVDVMAPGSSILSSVVLNNGSTTTYAAFNGTSMATPHVAGAIAAIKSYCPSATPAQIENALVTTGAFVADTRTGGTLQRPRIRVNLAIKKACTGWNIVGYGDFSGDGKSDILWRHVDGTVALWLMDGFTRTNSVFLAGVPNNWVIVGSGDFNGDGRRDVLWYDLDTRQVAVWLMGPGGLSIQSTAFLGGVGPGWQIVGTGDFNGDGRRDIVWRNRTDGSVAIWLIAAGGASVQSTSFFNSVPLSWFIASNGDFDNSGRRQLLWRNSSDGSVAFWKLDPTATAIQSTGFLGGAPVEWDIENTGNFDGDANNDIVWRNTNDGSVAVWTMNGFTPVNQGVVAGAPLSWDIAGVGSFFTPTKTDLLWHDKAGLVAIWQLTANGLGLAGSAVVGSAP